MNNKTIEGIYNLIINTKIEKIIDIQNTVNKIIFYIKSNNEIYKLVTSLFEATNVLEYFKNIFYLTTYSFLSYGIYINIKKLKGDKENGKK